MKNYRAWMSVAALAVGNALAGTPAPVGEPQALTVSLYDRGFALVQELRRLTLAEGENDATIRGVPATLDPATTAFTVTAGVKPVELLEQSLWTNGVAQPELHWVLRAGQAGPSTLRLTYRADGFRWTASHELVLESGSSLGRYSCRVALANQSGHDFPAARLRLLLGERGTAVTNGEDGRRFLFGAEDVVPDRDAAGTPSSRAYEFDEPVDLPCGPTRYVAFAASPKLPVRQLLVYDGVRFDRFQRNPRTDWKYGTESQGVIDTYVEFDNDQASGLGRPLPQGRLRVLREGTDGALDLLGEAALQPVGTGAVARICVGPAQGLHGERERTGYTEIQPLHEYEESFEIRVANDGERPARVKVVEHLYRGADFEITKSDVEYVKSGRQKVDFDIEVKPGGQRIVRYTVRYRW